MSYTVSLQRNPNLSIPQYDHTTKNEVLEKYGAKWWTGIDPQNCPGFNLQSQSLNALPLLNVEICNRQDVLDYFNNTWTLTELLFSSIKNESTYIRPPYHELRHPMMFYYGHPAVVYFNKMRLAGIFSEPIDLYLEKILETGVDEMSWDDMSKNQMAWPKIEAVWNYRKKVYEKIVDFIKNSPLLEIAPNRNLYADSPLWSLLMGMEHEKIHFETSSVLIRELPIELVDTPKYWVQQHPSSNLKTPTHPKAGSDFLLNEWKKINGGKISYGKPKNAPSFGWDNEYGTRTKNIKDFQVTQNLITNGEYYEFVSSLSYVNDKYWSQEGLLWRKFRNTKRPTFWVAHGPEGLHDYKLRTLFEVIDMPWNWPVEVNYHEAQAYCRWKQETDNSKLNYRLITEPEHVSLRDNPEIDPVLQKKHYSQIDNFSLNYGHNFNFSFSSASPIDSFPENSKGIRDVFGNVWQWAEDQFNPLDGFAVNYLYDDFSTPCFDGKHQMILGGSFMSCGHEASKWARFHFRPHFFQHAGFRIAATLDGSNDNESTKILTTTDYVHPRRENILDQMNNPEWWKSVNQPLEFDNSELRELWNSTLDFILNFEQNRQFLSPMGTALNPATNAVDKNFHVPYQGVTSFPQRSSEYKKLLQMVCQELAPTGQIPGHSGYMAYVAGAGNAISNMAQALAQTLNPYTAHYNMAPGLVTLENEALHWLTNMISFPNNTSGGFFTTGGSIANLSALSFARKNKFSGHDLSKAQFYASENSHHCIGKSLAILGFPQSSLKLIKVNQDFQIDTLELEREICADIQKGQQPICLIGTAGSTNTGSIDDLEKMNSIAKKYNIWFHVDGAYGAFFQLTEAGKQKLKGIEHADSVVLDPHKTLGLPYGTGCLLVKNKENMFFDYKGSTSYMPPSGTGKNEDPDFADITPELSRDFRGLRFWLPIKTLGIAPFQLNLEEKLKLTEFLAQEIKNIPALELTTRPHLTILNFKMKDGSKTKDLLSKINGTHKFFLSSCVLRNELIIRVCLLGFRSHFLEVRNLVEVIKNSLTELGV